MNKQEKMSIQRRGLWIEYYKGVIFCGVNQVWDEKNYEWEGVGREEGGEVGRNGKE